MAKRFVKRVLPMMLVVILCFGIFPVGAMAASPDISIEPTSGSDSSSDPGNITIEPTDPPDSSAPPDSSEPPSSGPSDPDSDPAEPEPAEDESDPAAEPGTMDGATVIIEGSSMARGFAAMATGTLQIHRFEQYQWDFTKQTGAPDMRPWYIMTIDGVLAYCIEPLNPETNSGQYQTIDYNALSFDQQYAIGYAMLYGAQDMSNPLFHMATQVIIWEIVYGYMELESFTATNNGAYNCSIGYNPGAAAYYSQITEAMRAHTEIPSFTHFYSRSAPIHEMPGIPGEYKVDLVNTNPNASLADFYFANTGTVSFVREGETLHVTSSGPLYGDTLYTAYKGSVGHTDSLIFWGSGNDQVRATAGLLDPVPAHFKLQTKDIGTYTITLEKFSKGTSIPLSGAQFHVRHTEKGEVGTFTTDGSGKVVVNVPWQGTYVCTEVVPPDNHKLDENPAKTVVVSADQPHVKLTYHNEPYVGLQIKKIDAVTGEPVADVVFRVSWEGGFRSQTVTTNAAGIARLADLEPGFYEVRELSCPPGYILNETPQTIEIRAGEVAQVIFENTPKPGLALQKLDSVTGQPMEGVEFEISKVSGERIGTYVTDAGGYIFVPIVDEQYVVIRETKTLPGYQIDTEEKLVRLEYGVLNRVYFTNSPYPYLVIVKIDEQTKQPLPDTSYKLMDETGREIGTYTTNQEGKIILTGIPAGKFKLQETQAAPGYVLDDTVWDIELRWGFTTTITLKNKPLDIDVTVEKRGVVECLPGDTVRYDFRNIANNSSVALEDFYWHDLLPTDAVRLTAIYTGTWNDDEMMYRVVYRTNLKENWTVLQDNLSAKVNHQLVCSAQVLGLASNEYITEFKFEFGTAKPGFREVKEPYIICQVLADLPDQYQFVNRTDVGGRYGNRWTYDKDTWITVVFKDENPKLPKTGVYL